MLPNARDRIFPSGHKSQGISHCEPGAINSTAFDLAHSTVYDSGSMSPLQAVSPNIPVPSLSAQSPNVKRVSSQTASPNVAQKQKSRENTLYRSSFTLSSPEFIGDLADDSKLGDLPSVDDLMLNFLDPPVPHEFDPQRDPLSTHHHSTLEAINVPLSNFLPEVRHEYQNSWVPQGNTTGLDGMSYSNIAASTAEPFPLTVEGPGFVSASGNHFNPLIDDLHDPEWEDNSTPKSTKERRLKRTATYNAGGDSSSAHRRKRTTQLGSMTAGCLGLQGEDGGDGRGSEDNSLDLLQFIDSFNTFPRTASNNTKNRRTAANAAKYTDDPGANTGQTFRGVSRHRLTQRWEASLWLAGRQLYLGGFDSQTDAAKAYDLAALACKGQEAVINFPVADYTDQLREIRGFSREEVVAYVRRRSAAFSRGKSKYRGVSGHNGRWEARIGSFLGRKNVSFGVFDSEEGAARQYDRALILEKGRSAKTNFPLRDYDAEITEYKAFLTTVSKELRGAALVRVMLAYTLPRDRVATADEKKRSAVIHGESLKRALES